MRIIFVLFLVLLLFSNAYTQDFQGFRSSNYSGVNGVFFNPANTVDNNYRSDFNLFSVSTLIGNNQASFTLNNLTNSFKGDSIKNQIFGKNAGLSSGMAIVDFRGPSVMFSVGKKNGFALTTRARVFSSVTDIDGKLVDKISDDFNNDPSLPYTLSSNQDMRVTANGWAELGLSYGRVITDDGSNYLKGGVTLKFLSGAGNAYMGIDNFNGTIDEDALLQQVFLRNTTGKIGMGFGGINFSDFEAGDLLKMKSKGFGADIGFIYEYKTEKSKNYLFKLGVAVTDIGSITYKKDLARSGDYTIDINDPERFDLSELDGVEFDDFNSFFVSHPQYFTPAASNNEEEYIVSLPSALHLTADFHVISGLYINVASQIALNSNKTKAFNNKVYNSFSATPRFETKRFGVYLPISYNRLSRFNAGASLRLGPLFVGSGSILSALMSHSKQADVFVGLRFGSLRK